MTLLWEWESQWHERSFVPSESLAKSSVLGFGVVDGACIMDVVIDGSRPVVVVLADGMGPVVDVPADGMGPVVVVLADGMGPVVVVTADELDSVVNPVSFPVWIPADTGKDNTCNIYACQTHYVLPPVIKHSPVFKLETGFINCARVCACVHVCVLQDRGEF